jgi:hypothetical protein
MTAARDLAEQSPELPGDDAAVDPPVVVDAAPPVADPPPVEPEPAAPTAEVAWLRALYTELSRAYGEQAARLQRYEEEAEARPPKPEEWKPLKRGCGVCGLNYEWVRKRAGLGLFKTRRELTTRGKPGRIFIEVNSVSEYWQRINAK